MPARFSRSISAIVSVIVLVGVFATPLLIAVIAPGFTGEKRELTISITRILFPGAGMLVLAAWCLGVLNSHHKFLLSYAAPVMWNAAMIATLLIVRRHGTALPRLAVLLAWGSVVGSVAAVPGAGAGRAAGRAGPARGVRHRVRPTCARSAGTSCRCSSVAGSCSSAPTSMRCSPACCPRARSPVFPMRRCSTRCRSACSACRWQPRNCRRWRGASLDEAGAQAVRARLDAGLRRIAFFVVPSSVAFLALGDVVAGARPADGALHAGGRGVRVGHSRGLVDWSGGVDARPALLVDVLRAARHEDAAAVRARARDGDDVLGYSARFRCLGCSASIRAGGQRG